MAHTVPSLVYVYNRFLVRANKTWVGSDHDNPAIFHPTLLSCLCVYMQ